MEPKKEEKDEITEENSNSEEIKLLKVSIWRVFAYFIIYSIIGYVLETLFGLVTKGVIESRKSFLYGPFCAIYGVGAAVMIIFLKHFDKNKKSLFIGGVIVGTVTEYLVSLFGEIMLQVKWWDYSNLPLNINGRVCLLFSVIWGILALVLMLIVNPFIDKQLDWLKNRFTAKVGRTVLGTAISLIAIDWLISTIAVGLFLTRMVAQNNLNVENKELLMKVYDFAYSNEIISNITYKHFGDERLIKNFPDLKTTDVNGNIIFFKDLLPDIQPYYFRVFNKSVETHE